MTVIDKSKRHMRRANNTQNTTVTEQYEEGLLIRTQTNVQGTITGYEKDEATTTKYTRRVENCLTLVYVVQRLHRVSKTGFFELLGI